MLCVKPQRSDGSEQRQRVLVGSEHQVRLSATYQNTVRWSTLSTAPLSGCTRSKNAERVHWPNLQLW